VKSIPRILTQRLPFDSLALSEASGLEAQKGASQTLPPVTRNARSIAFIETAKGFVGFSALQRWQSLGSN
jgi:hypothetical protein